MSDTIREKTKLLNRVRRIRGQVEAVERALEHEIGCAGVLQLITGAGAIDGLMGEVVEDRMYASYRSRTATEVRNSARPES